jgi:seryl-tRNA synthetase
METRFGTKKQTSTRKEYVHALNSTLSAIQRALCCVLENYQTEEGVVVPEVLRRFMPDEEEFIPWVRELPKDSTSQRVADKKAVDTTKKKIENLKV